MSKYFLKENLIYEISNLIDKKYDIKLLNKEISDDIFFEIEIANLDELIEISSKIIFYSRCVKNIFLKIVEFEKFSDLENNEDNNISLKFDFLNKNLTYEIDAKKLDENRSENEIGLGKYIKDNFEKLKVDLKNFDLSFKVIKIKDYKNKLVLLDLVNFPLTKREHKLNQNSSMINPLIPVHCFYELKLDKKENISIIDPLSNLGEIIIEANLFNPRKNLFEKHKYNMPIYKLFKTEFLKSCMNLSKEINKKYPQDIKNKFLGIVQNNKIFKEQKENINFAAVKIKLSQYELDWLDVKFKDSEIDYLITQLPYIKEKEEFEELQKELFYQGEFITKNKICIISKKEINKKYLTKNKLKLEKEELIILGEQKYYIYFIKK